MSNNRISIPNEIMLAEVSRLLAEGSDVIIMTKGCSMLPFIRGDRDSVELHRFESYKPGDIALCRLPEGRWVLHRIVRIEGDKVLLKGDGNLVGTERCLTDDIAGAVTFILKPLGRKVDCRSGKELEKARRWNARSYENRRIILGILRRATPKNALSLPRRAAGKIYRTIFKRNHNED